MFEKLYMKSLDEIDMSISDQKEILFRQSARYISLAISFACYLFLVLLYSILLFFVDKRSKDIIDAVIVNGVIKTNRLIWYHIIYQPCRLVGLLLDNINQARN